MSRYRDYRSSRPRSPPPPYESHHNQPSYDDRTGYADTRRSARNDEYGRTPSPRPRSPFPSFEDRHTDPYRNDSRRNDARRDAYNDRYDLTAPSDPFSHADRAESSSARPYDTMTPRYPSPPAHQRTPSSSRQFDSSKFDAPLFPPVDQGFGARTGDASRREGDNWRGGQDSSMSRFDTMRSRSPAPAPAAEEQGLTWINVHPDGKFCGCDRCNAARAGRPTIEEEMAADYRAKGLTVPSDCHHAPGPHERAARAGNSRDLIHPLNRPLPPLSGRNSILLYGRRGKIYDLRDHEFSLEDFMFDDDTHKRFSRR